MRQGAGDGGIGDAEHRLLETGADLDAHIPFTAAAPQVPIVQRLGQVPVHVLHQQAGGNPRPHGGQGIGEQGAVGELGLVGRNLLGLGIEANRAQKGHAPQKHRFDVGHGHIGQEGQAGFRRQHREALLTDRHRVGDRLAGGSHQALLEKVHHLGDRGHPAVPFGGGKVDKQITHHPPELAEGMGGSSGANQLGQKLAKQGIQHGQEQVLAALRLDDGCTEIGKGLGIQVGVKATGAMPKHGLHAIFGVFKINAIVVEMAPDLGRAQIAIKELKDRERVEKLLLRLIDQVAAIGIENHAVTLQHRHHFQDMVGGFR